MRSLRSPSASSIACDPASLYSSPCVMLSGFSPSIVMTGGLLAGGGDGMQLASCCSPVAHVCHYQPFSQKRPSVGWPIYWRVDVPQQPSGPVRCCHRCRSRCTEC
eukprot:scaffold2981_cov215-Prasinococcus_capsulatus_cf.AAC.1